MTEKKKTKKKSKAQEDLEIENKRLKDELRKVAIHLKELQDKEKGGEFTHSAIGCSKKDGKFYLDRISYNPDTKEGIVKVSEELTPNPKSYASLLLNLEKIASLEISKNVEEK